MALYLFIVCLDYVLHTFVDEIEDKGFTLQPAKSNRFPTVTVTDGGYADDLALQADEVCGAESLLHKLESADKGVNLYVKSDESVYMMHK
uniref:Uncharacterized protein n=1 Tax=Octopus bimaculoides TaxID=37653 RepID=A0A0L8I047_OCTBM